MAEQKTTSTEIAVRTAEPLALPETPTIAKDQPPREKLAIGVSGYLRLLRIALSFFLFAARLLFNNRRWLRSKKPEPDLRHAEGAALRAKLLALGPTFIKIGQTLATRADLLPVEYIQELSKLQDEVPPFPNDQAREIITRELKADIADVFKEFETDPIAAASLGQVYRATFRPARLSRSKSSDPTLPNRSI